MTTATGSWIEKNPGVLGGEACIRRMRIAVWMLVNKKFRHGMSEERILAGYPELLTIDDLTTAWTYYENHREEIDEAIQKNEELEDDERE